MKKSECFRKALKYLVPDWGSLGEPHTKTRFICHAIRAVNAPKTVKDACEEVVTDRLEGFSTVLIWLCVHEHGTEETRTPEAIQAYRKRWLEELAREFEEKGE